MILEKTHRLTIVTYCMICFLQSKPFHVRVLNLSTKAIPLLKTMVVAYAAEPPFSEMTTSSFLDRQPEIETHECPDHPL